MMLKRLFASFSRLLRVQDGATVVEFALVSPLFFAFMIGAMEVAVVMFTNVAIEAAVRDGARYGITGNAPEGTTREERLRQIISERTFGLVSPTSEDITMKVYPNFAAAGEDEAFEDVNGNGMWDAGEPFTDANGNGVWDGGTPGMGGAGEVVLYTISYQLPMIGPVVNNLFGVTVLKLSTRIVVRNEPWNPS
jgi:Flp pilus assembly pilin Flp